MNAERPGPRRNGGVRGDGHAATPPSSPNRPVSGGVSRLDRVTLQLGVVVAVVIALCSYAVSATSLYALVLGDAPIGAVEGPGRQWWWG